ncbi:MAG TPA: diguanylate cyclase, partial [Dehalococcoidia bacterium]|nr:diguanylate cyclase [Dehalococcoidia bacterium]
MLQELRDLTRLAGRPDLGVADLIEACGQVRSVLGAEDAYVMASGDPDFVRVGCPCAPNTYEIKQKGYWLIWREVVTNQQIAAGLFNVEERLVGPGAPLVAGRAATHLAAVLPGDESNSEIMVVRGPWAQGLTDAQIAFVEVARTIVSQIASAVLDAGRQARQRAQLEALASVATAFSEAREDERVLSAVATALAKASGFDWVTIAVYDDEQRRVVDRALNVARHSETETARLWRDNEGIRSVTNDGGGMTGLFGLELVKHGGPVFIPDVFDATQDEEPHMAAVRAIMPGLRKYYERAHILSVALFPIVFQGKVIGDLSFSSSTRRAFDHAEADFLRALAAQTATTIKGMRLFRDLEHSREELRRSEERFRSLVQNASDLVTVIDADTTITYQSPSIERLLGYTPDQVVGTRLSHLLHNDDVARTLAVLHDAMTDAGAQAAAEVRVRHIDGSWRDVEFIGTNQFSNPAIAGFVLNIRDITERKLLEQQLRHQALHDPLTRLANRTRFSDRLEHALVRATRTGNAVAVLFMDLDNFKGVNDSLGHAAGDHLLTQVAERVQACIRPGDTVARLGGDEFAILLEEVATQDVAVAVTERIMEGLRASFRVEDKDLLVRASIGIAISGPGGAGDAESLLRDADVAMYVAKSQGKACYRIFEPSMQVSMMERLELIADLQRAIDRGEFMLQYQ